MARFTYESEQSANRRRTAFAFVAFLLSGFLCGAAMISVAWAALENPGAGEYVQQKLISIRVRAGEILQPPVPEFVPTPFTSAVIENPSPEPEPTDAPAASPTDSVALPAVTARPTAAPTRAPTQTPTRPPAQAIQISAIQPTAMLSGVKHDWQKWNNCAPTTLEMNLSYYGLKDTQAQIAAFTKPNPEDKNVRPDELGAYVATVNMRSIIRVNGTLDRLKLFISNGIPVIAETAYVKQPQGWMGHYRLFVGYDDKQFTAMDSYDGPNQKVPFAAFDEDWRAFNRLYLIVYRREQETLVRTLLADTLDDSAMYTAALARARAESKANPKDAFSKYNEGTNLLALKRYAEAAAAYDQARQIGLPWRMLWYQFGPYESYLQTRRFDEVLGLADATLKTSADLEEAHYYRGLALQSVGRAAEAKAEFETALKYNKNYQAAQRALAAFIQ